MMKPVTALIAAAAAGWVLAGSAASVSAHQSYYPGCNCGPVTPSTYYKTVHPAKFLTQYHDVSVYKNVTRIHQVVNVTRVQPIIHINDVTRVHHHTIVQTRNAYSSVTQELTPIRYVQRSVQNYYDCSCGH